MTDLDAVLLDHALELPSEGHRVALFRGERDCGAAAGNSAVKPA